MDKITQVIRDIIFAGIDLLEKGLGVTFVTMLIQLAATLVLFLVIRFTVWKKITKVLEDRRALVAKGLEDKDKAIMEAETIRLGIVESQAKAKKDAANIIEEAKKRAQAEGKEIIRISKAEAQEEKSKAMEEIRHEKERLEKELSDKVVDVAYLMAEKIIEEELDAKKHKKLIDQFIDKAGKN